MVTIRSAAVAKMEEQLALLLAKMEEQSQQLQLLTTQTSQRVGEVAKQQEETREQVQAIAEDLESVKSTVHGRLGDVEEAVTSVKTLQAELGERQKSLKAELHDELLRELSEVGKAGLRPTAPPFYPVEAVSPDTVVATDGGGSGADGRLGDGRVPGSSSGGSGTTMQRPAPFDGKGTWDAYHTQFEMLARINRWTDLDKAAYLAISLRGPAATVLTNLPPDQR